ncbi:MAG: cupin [Thaumarchaeota archaeon]|nr:cupin [Nitrososphaerota archaeon]
MKSNIYAPGNRRTINPNWFTGPVHMKDISSTIQSKGHDMYHVYFKNKAKTKLHQHNGNQVLIVTSGNGSLEFFKKIGNKKSNFGIKKTSTTKLVSGDIAYIPKNTLHTHGSTSRKTFSHIAINIIPNKANKYQTIWYDSDFASHAFGIV